MTIEDIKSTLATKMDQSIGAFKNNLTRIRTGLGVRWFSPVAPFSFDIAYGHNDKKIRWHISLGTHF